jgi:hypothetical protein
LGATTSVIFDTLVIPKYYKREKGTFGSVKLADSDTADFIRNYENEVWHGIKQRLL